VAEMNQWGIPDWLEKEVTERDTHCVYCGIRFDPLTKACKSKPSWVHIDNDVRITTRQNIARCCTACNASKGAKLLEVWLSSNYCKMKKITKDNVAQVVKEALISPPAVP
jgi:hypothetical protein